MQRLSSPGGYGYNPNTLIIEMPERMTGVSPAAHHLGLIHECHYWLQFQGTTFGALLAAIRACQEDSVCHFLARLPPVASYMALSRRLDPPWEPVLRIDENLDVALSGGRPGPLEGLASTWHDHQMVLELPDLQDARMDGTPGPRPTS